MTADILATHLCESWTHHLGWWLTIFYNKINKKHKWDSWLSGWDSTFFSNKELCWHVCDVHISKTFILPLLFVTTVHPLKGKILFICLLVWFYHISSYESFDGILKCSTTEVKDNSTTRSRTSQQHRSRRSQQTVFHEQTLFCTLISFNLFNGCLNNPAVFAFAVPDL